MNKGAFTLTELLVAIALFSILALLLFDFWLVSNIKLNNQLEEELAMDLIMRDLVAASPEPWDKENFVFSVKGCDVLHKDVSWKLDKGRLLRVEGKYFPYHEWIEKTTSVATKNIDMLHVSYKEKESVVVVILGNNEVVVRLRNG